MRKGDGVWTGYGPTLLAAVRQVVEQFEAAESAVA
jgi:hypothetical protein